MKYFQHKGYINIYFRFLGFEFSLGLDYCKTEGGLKTIIVIIENDITF